MTTLEIIVLAIVQGITEFLPISSSAHLVLPSAILGWQNDLAFDVAVHLGSLLAVMLYFRRDIVSLMSAWIASITAKQQTEQANLSWWLILATLPVVFAGFFFKPLIETVARSEWVIATTTILFGLLLWYADYSAKQTKSIPVLGWKGSLLIGLSQMLALIPGTSRSGITITTGLMLGLNREDAARFSFLLSIPVILGAATLSVLDLLKTPDGVNWGSLLLGTTLSFISAYACIYMFLRWIASIGMLPFVIYRLLLGSALILYIALS